MSIENSFPRLGNAGRTKRFSTDCAAAAFAAAQVSRNASLKKLFKRRLGLSMRDYRAAHVN